MGNGGLWFADKHVLAGQRIDPHGTEVARFTPEFRHDVGDARQVRRRVQDDSATGPDRGPPVLDQRSDLFVRFRGTVHEHEVDRFGVDRTGIGVTGFGLDPFGQAEPLERAA